MQLDYSPKGLYFHTFQINRDDAYLNAFYISVCQDRIEHVDDFMHNPNVIAFLEFYTDDETDKARVTNVNVIKEYRGRGFSFYLLLKMACYLSSVGVTEISLDDDSDRYHKPGNLYYSLGFEYDAEYGPEMSAKTETLLRGENFTHFRKWEKFYNV